jgi:hypothetical protein
MRSRTASRATEQLESVGSGKTRGRSSDAASWTTASATFPVSQLNRAGHPVPGPTSKAPKTRPTPSQRDTRTAHNCKRQGRPPAQPQSRVPTAQRVPHTFCRPRLRLIQLAPRAAPSTARTELRSCPSEGANAIVASRATVAEGLGRLLVPRPAASGPRSPGTRWREARWCLTGRRDRSPKPMNGSHEEKRDEPQRVVETVSQDWGPQGAVVDPQHAPHARVERHDDDAEESLLGVAETEKHG